MSKRIGVTIATVLASAAVGLTSAATAGSSTVREIQRPPCPSNCPAVYAPVTCTLSDGRVMTFSNRCQAGVFACRAGVTIVSCVEGV